MLFKYAFLTVSFSISEVYIMIQGTVFREMEDVHPEEGPVLNHQITSIN